MELRAGVGGGFERGDRAQDTAVLSQNPLVGTVNMKCQMLGYSVGIAGFERRNQIQMLLHRWQ